MHSDQKQEHIVANKRLQDLAWEPGFAELGNEYGSPQPPTAIDSPYLVAFNPNAAALLNLDPGEAARPEFAETFSGNSLPNGATPFSQLYAGHQFGVWAGQLGDGRAISLGQLRNAAGAVWDVQLKGSGKTPYSRFADGRAVLRSTIREYLGSAAMVGLGIPTTRALCIVGSDAPVYRETVETSAILTRLAPSHVRFGNFEMFFYSRQFELLGPLADHVINAHFPQLKVHTPGPERYRAWMAEVIQSTAELIADWQAVGFCHGVMNTDNMSVLGLTLDYGPFGFLDHFDPGWVCNHSDTAGRYAYNQQPEAALWNLGRFAQAILPLLSDEPDEAVSIAQSLLGDFRDQYDAAYLTRMASKLGLADRGTDGLADAGPQDKALLDELLKIMARDEADFTRSFRALCHVSAVNESRDAVFQDEFKDRAAASAWLAQWRTRVAAQGLSENGEHQARMLAANPKYILRNYLAQAAIERAQAGDYAEIERLQELLSKPYNEQPGYEDYARLPPASAALISISCSS